MDSHALSHEMQALLSHQPWVRDLARRLVQDPNVAEDLAQETFLAALKSTATPPGSRRAWLARVLRNQLFERMRSEDRRRTRELARPHEEESPSTLDLVERMAVHRQVVETVMDLPEHYREVLLRRYFEGETPTDIAAHLGIPLSTVKTRLARGLAQMRERLDQRHGGDGVAWSLALLPLLERGGRGATLVTAKSLGAAAMLVVLGSAAWLVLRSAPSAPRRDAGEPFGLAAPALPPSGPAPEPPAAARAGLDPTPTNAVSLGGALASFTERRATQAGRVLDPEGRPLAGVVVRFEAAKQDPSLQATGSAIALTDAGGNFELAGVRGQGRIEALGDGRVTLFQGVRAGQDTDHTTLVVAPAIAVAGHVRGPRGETLAGADVEFELPAELARGLSDGLGNSTARRFRAHTDAQGHFALAPLPAVAGAHLRVRYEGLAEASVAAPLASRDDLDVELAARVLSPDAVRGTVVDTAGRPVPGARVSEGVEVVRSDDLGRFALEAREADAFGRAATTIVAYHPTLGAARAVAAESGPAWPEELRLELAAPRTIRGRVRDAAGRPLRDVTVWVGDPTVFRDPETPVDGSVLAWRLSADEPHPIEYAEILESLLAGSPDPWTYARSDGEGRFELTGLLARPYEVVAMDHSSLLRTTVRGIPAGAEDVELTLDLGRVLPRLEGRVVSFRGEPVAGVRVSLATLAFRAHHRGREAFSQRYEARAVVSDAAGRFVLHDVPATDTFLLLGGPRVLDEMRSFEGSTPGAELTLTVSQRVAFEVVLSDPTRADTLVVVDAEGRTLPLVREGGQRRESHRRARFFEGRSGLYETSDAAAELVLSRGGVEVERLPLALRPGAPQRLVH